MQKKARPLDVEVEVLNKKDWRDIKNLDIKVKGMFRDSSWKIKEVAHQVAGNIIQINIISKKNPGMALMVLTPFEIIEKVALDQPRDNYKIRVVVDGDETAIQGL